MMLAPRDLEVLSFVQEAACKFGSPKRIILFGSRARGDHKPLSDYDIGVEGDSDLTKNWAKFWNKVDECAPTLCKIDLVLMNSEIADELRTQILSQGIEFTLKGEHLARN